jgi:excinuclease ABC subunit A
LHPPLAALPYLCRLNIMAKTATKKQPAPELNWQEALPANDTIEVFGARVHNLKNIDISIPKNQLVVITGISGSGKSSLAFDTIYSEGQRRYLETFGAYLRQFVGDMERPDVDKITGLSPVISIEQKTTNKNPRSTVGTITEIYDFLRLLFARAGEAYSYNTGKKMVKWSEEEILQNIYDKYAGQKITLLAPLVRGRKGHYRELFEEIRKKGFVKVRVDGEIKDLAPKMQVDRFKIHDIEVVIDRLVVEPAMKTRLSQSLQQTLKMGKDLMFAEMINGKAAPKIISFSKQLMCEDTGISYEEPSPNAFSFNSPYGACPACRGLGQVSQVSLDAVMPDKTKSINDGGIAPLGEEREAYVFKKVQEVAKKNKISLDKPLKDLSEKSLNILLYGNETGSVDDDIDFGADTSVYSSEFEGIVNQLKRWFNNSSTEAVQQWAESFMELAECDSCNGARLKKESLWFKINECNIAELGGMGLEPLMDWFVKGEKKLSKKQIAIGKDVLKEIKERLQFLLDVGLTYLTLNRPSRSLSGGESQRIRLATQIGSQLQGITYILDEPSIGLHQRDNQRLIEALKNLRDVGNSVLVVEHDKDIMMAADHLIDVGPKAGWHGGRIVASGTPAQVKKGDSITAAYLNGKSVIPVPAERRKGNGKHIELTGVSGHNLQNVSVKLPLGTFILVTGVSGSGKSTLITDTLYPILNQYCYNSRQKPMPYKNVKGLENIDKVIEIDQSPIGRTPRSNPATYCGFFNEIRQLFAAVPEAKIRGYNPGRFSFNVKTGRCDVCEGGGMRVIEMNFLPDVYVPCEKCQGKRYNRETLEIRYKGKSISDVLNMTVDDAVEFFQPVHFLYRKIKVLHEVGLGYITLGQSAVTLSGGEAQRVKLSTELAKRDTGKTFYILDEPTTGLHFEDIRHLLDVLNKLVDRGNTVLVIEHNMDVIKVADYIIDMGPEGGDGGGQVLHAGTPESLLSNKKSHTARFLKEELK